jgi:hypothetical protein
MPPPFLHVEIQSLEKSMVRVLLEDLLADFQCPSKVVRRELPASLFILTLQFVVLRSNLVVEDLVSIAALTLSVQPLSFQRHQQIEFAQSRRNLAALPRLHRILVDRGFLLS